MSNLTPDLLKFKWATESNVTADLIECGGEGGVGVRNRALALGGPLMGGSSRGVAWQGEESPSDSTLPAALPAMVRRGEVSLLMTEVVGQTLADILCS